MSGPRTLNSDSYHMPQPRASSKLSRRKVPRRSKSSTNGRPSNIISGSQVASDSVQSTREASSSPAQVETKGRSQPSLLQHAQNIGISGGSFVNAAGDFVSPHVTYSGNITIHNHHGRTQRHVEGVDDPQLAPSQLPVANQTTNAENKPLSSPLPIQKSCDIYRRLLAVKGRGFPLWIPGPSANLPIEYRRAGIAIGDVGILTNSGSFDFLFNICLPAHHPINQAGVPEGFYPLDDIPLSDILRHDEFDAGSHVASTFVEAVRYNDTPLTNALSFESSAREGAILTMPNGAVAQDLASVIHFEDYMAQHSESWYKYIIGVRGRKIGNGGVRLVIGADMAPAWGMATFSQSSAQCSPLQLRFKPTAVSPAGQTYGWEYSGVADAKSGPSFSEIERLHSDDKADKGSRSRYMNQSLFVRTLTVTFEKTIWDELISSINSTRISARARASRKPANVYSLVGTSRKTSSVTTDDSTTTWTRAKSAGDSFQASTTAPLPEPSLYIVGDSTNMIVHPSNEINDLIMKKAQNIFSNETPRMIITKDQDWISVLDKNDLVLPSSEELYRRIMDTQTLGITITNNGVLLLESVLPENTLRQLPTETRNSKSISNNLPQRADPQPTNFDEKSTALRSTKDPIFILRPAEPRSISGGTERFHMSPAATGASNHHLEEGSNTARQLFNDRRDDPKDNFIIGSGKGSNRITSFVIPPSPPPPLGPMALDIDPGYITSPPLLHTPSYNGSYYSHSQQSDFSFSGDDVQMDDITCDDIQMQDVSGSMGDYEPSDYDAPNQPPSLWIFNNIDWLLSNNHNELSLGIRDVRRASSAIRSDRGAEVWGTQGNHGMSHSTSRRMSPYPDPKASSRVGHMDWEFDSDLTLSRGANGGSSGENAGLGMAWRASGSDLDVTSADTGGSWHHEVGSSEGSQPGLSFGHRQRTQDANFECSVPGWDSIFTSGFSFKRHLRSHLEEDLATQEYASRGMNPDSSPSASPGIWYADLDLDPDLSLNDCFDDVLDGNGTQGMAKGWGTLDDSSVNDGCIEEVALSRRSSHSALDVPNTELVVSVDGGQHSQPHNDVPSASQTDVPSQIAATTERTAHITHRRSKQEAKFICTVPGCGSAFTRNINLKGHLRAHFQDKTYKCHWAGCGKGFATQHDCKRHEQLHSNFRPFECEGCRRQFARMDALNKHLKSEIGVECAKIVETMKRKRAGGSEIGMGSLESEGDIGGMVEQGKKLEEERQTGSVAL